MLRRWKRPRWAAYGAAFAIVHVLSFGSLAAEPPAPAKERLIWAFGDSLTAGYGLPPAQGFPVQLEQALRRGGIAAMVRNGGVAGDTAAQGKARLAWGLRGLGTKPDLVLVELGANDMLRGLPPAAAEQNLDLILAELKRRRITVLIVGMLATPNLGPAYVRAFDGMFAHLARKYEFALYPFFLDGVAGNPSLFQADGRHPNARGVQIIVARMIPSVKAALRMRAR